MTLPQRISVVVWVAVFAIQLNDVALLFNLVVSAVLMVAITSFKRTDALNL